MKRKGESQTEWVVRVIKAVGWQEAHDLFCDFGAGCKMHQNPYRDEG